MGSRAHVARAKTDCQMYRHKQRRVSKCDSYTARLMILQKQAAMNRLLSNISRHLYNKKNSTVIPTTSNPVGWERTKTTGLQER